MVRWSALKSEDPGSNPAWVIPKYQKGTGHCLAGGLFRKCGGNRYN